MVQFVFRFRSSLLQGVLGSVRRSFRSSLLRSSLVHSVFGSVSLYCSVVFGSAVPVSFRSSLTARLDGEKLEFVKTNLWLTWAHPKCDLGRGIAAIRFGIILRPFDKQFVALLPFFFFVAVWFGLSLVPFVVG